MTFPIWINLGFTKLHPHILFEALAYFIGFRVYLMTRSKDKLPVEQGMWVIVGAILGAAVGSKVLYWLEDPLKTIENWSSYTYLMEGKTIIGGLLGGLIGVEWIKKRIGITRSTGDDMALPIILGMAIGRIGCFMTGLDDHTYGTPTSWGTGVDFGDGIPRHPTQLYEITFLLLLGASLLYWKRRMNMRTIPSLSATRTIPEGALFQLFMTGYLLFRFGIDFIKPTPHPFLGLNNIQLASLVGLIYYVSVLCKWVGKTHGHYKEAYHHVNKK
ncbi:prolipoprotein diacylglyceryl transferase [Paenibacillus rigui]|uniref:Diacylglyceryl transferase n=1 Tax=Paenibacillus rigui TaxID=554312 RepID=A0A229UKD8_9BACL|nr:prolipoprotein diacylglyceryl transferase family protein [Paenibacillus rigui]OXM83853.1 diacylglyceryl transferase [Paenibacillus rigui]